MGERSGNAEGKIVKTIAKWNAGDREAPWLDPRAWGGRLFDKPSDCHYSTEVRWLVPLEEQKEHRPQPSFDGPHSPIRRLCMSLLLQRGASVYSGLKFEKVAREATPMTRRAAKRRGLCFLRRLSSDT